MSKEIHVDYDSGATICFVRLNGEGKVALTDGSAWEEWGETSGYDMDEYKVPVVEVGSGGYRYVGDFDAGGNITHSDIRIYSLIAFVKSGSVYTRIAQGIIVWDGKKEVEHLLSYTGFTVGGVLSVVTLLKLLAAMIEGNWTLESIATGITKWLVSDADSKSENVLRVTLREDENPYKQVTRL